MTERRPPKMVSLRTGYKSRPSTGISYVQILGTGMDTGDTSPSVLLFFDNKRFIFNAGEGLQRFCVEHKIKLSKIDHVLFTRVCSETTGGLPGMLLTLAGEVAQTVNLWGPSDLRCLLSAMSTFLPNSSMLHAHSFGPETHFDAADVLVDDEVVKIYGVFLHSCRDEGSLLECKANMEARDLAVSYICKLPEIKGKFNPARAAALGLKPGIKYGQLQAGISVQSDDGQQTIHPSDVMESSTPGPVFILVDCPSVSHVFSLISSTAFQKFKGAEASKLICIVHISPLSVIEDTRYLQWMATFCGVQHILAGPGCCRRTTPVFKSSASILAKLNLICPQVFPIDCIQKLRGDLLLFNTAESGMSNVVFAHNLLKFYLRPLSLFGLENSVPDDFDVDKIQEDTVKEAPELLSIKQDINRLWAEAHDKQDANLPLCLTGNRNEMELVFLGTGSSHPCKHRNVSAMYLHLFERGGMLIDCGEGTYGQLRRRYGGDTDSIVANLKCIWISHIHADHQSGLVRMLVARKRLLVKQEKLERIIVIGPVFLRRFLTAYEKLEDLAMDFLDCSQTTLEANLAAEQASGGSKRTFEGIEKKKLGDSGYHVMMGLDEIGRNKLSHVLAEMGLKLLLSVPVIHCAHAFGLVVEAMGRSGHAGWKYAYSGDTRPCDAFVEASKGATLFVHEATFDDGLIEEALYKNHSLTCEAVRAGAAASAYRTVLTHFSQRYPKIPVFDESHNDSTCIAFDMMSVNMADLPLLPKLMPALKLLFKDEIESPED